MRRPGWILNAILGLVLLAVGAGAFAVVTSSSSSEASAAPGQTSTVIRGDVVETVSATGNLTANRQVGVDFTGTGGTVTRIYVSVGDKVKEGERLAKIDDTTARQQLRSAEASLDSANAQYETARAGQTNAEQVNSRTYAQNVAAARVTLADAEASWSESCLSPDGECPDQAVWAQLRAAEGEVSSAKVAYEQAVQSGTRTQETNQVKLGQAQVNVDAARSTQTTQCDTYGSTSSACTSAVSATRSAEQALELQQQAISAADITAQQSLVNADARITAANVALRKLQGSLRSSAQDAVRSARNALDSALLAQDKGRETAKQSTGSTQGQIDQASAQVRSAQVQVDQARTALDDTVLRAPVAGTVSSVSGTVGESSASATGASGTSTSSSTTTGFVVLSSLNRLEVTSRVAEADASRISVGQPASVSFSAAGTTAEGVVTDLDVQDTVTNNVVEYGVTVSLIDPPKNLKLGQTAAVTITTGSVTDVLWVPASAVTSLAGNHTVTVRNSDGTDSSVPVQVGLTGGDRTEIVSGLTEGQTVVLPTGSGLPSGFTFPNGGPGGIGGGLG